VSALVFVFVIRHCPYSETLPTSPLSDPIHPTHCRPSRGSTWRLLSAKVRRRRGEERGSEQRKRGPISSLFQPNAMPPPEKRREGKGKRDVQVNQLVGRSRGGRSILDRTRFIFASSALEAMKQVPTHTGARTEQARKQGGTENVSNSGVSFDRGQGKRRTSEESSVGGLELLDRTLERGGRRSRRAEEKQQQSVPVQAYQSERWLRTALLSLTSEKVLSNERGILGAIVAESEEVRLERADAAFGRRAKAQRPP
jgi:hypothetical protein